MLSPFVIYAQQFYLKAQSGKNYPMNKSSYESASMYHTIYDNFTSDSVRENTSFYSLGKGREQHMAIGYDLNKYLALELGFSYLQGLTSTFSWKENYEVFIKPEYYLHINYKVERKGGMLSTSPALIIHAHSSRINPFLKVGLQIAYCSLQDKLEMKTLNTIPSYIGSEHMESILKFKDQTAVGYVLGAGMEINMFHNLSSFLSGEISQLSIKPTSASRTSYIVDDEDLFSSLSISEKEFVYSDSPLNNTPVNQPSQLLANKVSFSSWSINFGLKYSFVRDVK